MVVAPLCPGAAVAAETVGPDVIEPVISEVVGVAVQPVDSRAPVTMITVMRTASPVLLIRDVTAPMEVPPLTSPLIISRRACHSLKF